MSDYVIELDDVRRYYLVGDYIVKALDGVTLKIPRGAFTAIMGPSGSGKSTMMNLIGCLDTATSGYIQIDGELTNDLEEAELAFIRNQKIGFVFQQFNLLGKMTALENVMTPMVYANYGVKERKERAEFLLEKVGLKDRMKHLPNELSGGQKQRVAIARALVNDPAILLADEPTGALDSKTSQDIICLLKNISAKLNQTLIIVTHDPIIARQCRRIITLKDGRIIGDEQNGE